MSFKARFLALWSVAILATAAAFVAHLALRHQTVQLGYDVGAARRAQRQLIEQRRLLAIEAATLRQPDRIETIARGTLDMDVPEPARVVPVGQQAHRERTAGRMR
jgi:cell division protein FtsL